MKKLKEELKYGNKGITLISLVVTIIVLLILAGVTIATLTGDNGILTKASESKEKTQIASEDELRSLTALEAATYFEEHEYIDVSGKKIIIPAQCAVSQIEGENTLDEGLVIIDTNGNEWVWIEVPKTIEVYPTAGLNIIDFTDDDYTKIYEDLANYVETYKDRNNKGTLSGTDNWYDGCGLQPSEYEALKQKMLKSIYMNEGFFIGRYEVGIDEENTVRYYEEDFYTEKSINETPVIKKNRIVYNWVTVSQAQELSEKLAIGGKTSSLIFGIQWNLVLKYIENKGAYIKDETDELINQTLIKLDSTKWGNCSNSIFNIMNIDAKYSDNNGASYISVPSKGYKKTNSSILLTTGATDRNAVAGIYDFAGNVDEWTLEKTTNNNVPCNARGGNYTLNGYEYPSSCYGDCQISSSLSTVEFRVALY